MIAKALLRVLLVFSLGVAAQADVRLHNLFTDHMVLQQRTSVPVWGWADDGEKVTVEFHGRKVSTTAKNVGFECELDALVLDASAIRERAFKPGLFRKIDLKQKVSRALAIIIEGKVEAIGEAKIKTCVELMG